jgi:hypothetical protein
MGHVLTGTHGSIAEIDIASDASDVDDVLLPRELGSSWY